MPEPIEKAENSGSLFGPMLLTEFFSKASERQFMNHACPVCRSRDKIRQFDSSLALYRCEGCDHTFPVLGKHESPQIYNEEYFFETHANWFSHPDLKLFNQIRETVRSNFEKKEWKLLDVGCGKGSFLKHLRKSSPDIQLFGIDLAPNESPGIRFMQGDFSEVEIKERFDAIVSLATLEHIRDPNPFIEKISGLLLPGGLLFLTTNNCHGLVYAAAKWAKDIGFRAPFDRLYSRHHLQHFVPRSLTVLLERNGFEILSLKNHNCPLSAVDTPPAHPVMKWIYRTGVVLLFALSSVLGNQFLQVAVCRKKTT